MLGVIDGDLVLYSTLFYHQARRSDENPYTCGQLEELCREGVKGVVREWARDAKCEDYYVALSQSPNFRHKIDPEYKANRKDGERPVYFDEALQELRDTFQCLEFPGLIEADDIMGIMATHYKDGVIISYDKDMKQIPGYHYNPKQRGASGINYITVDEARKTFYIQWLTGDSTDNIKGIPGIGPKKAEKLWGSIKAHPDPIEKTLECFTTRGISRERAIKDFHLVKILSQSDWDFESNTMKEVDYGKTPEEPQCYRTRTS